MTAKEINNKKPSELAQFQLGFELTETWSQARKKYTTKK